MSWGSLKKAALLTIACQLLLLSHVAAQSRYIIDIRPLEKDIRKIEKLKPLRSIDQKSKHISNSDTRKTSSQKTDIAPRKPK